jgi:hypothetical protein
LTHHKAKILFSRKGRTEQNRTEQNRTEQNRTEQNRTEQKRDNLSEMTEETWKKKSNRIRTTTSTTTSIC